MRSLVTLSLAAAMTAYAPLMMASPSSSEPEASPTHVIPPPALLDSVKQEPALQGPTRRAWAERGIIINSRLIEQAAVNDRGYAGDGWKFVQDINLGVTLDLARLGVADQGLVRVLFSDRSGHSLQEFTGAYFQNQSNFGQGQNFRFDELSYERSLLGTSLNVKAGFFSMGNDFALLPYTCNFTSNAFCAHPLALTNGSGWQNAPTGQWGVRARWNDPQGWYAAVGAFDITPRRRQHDYGLDLGFPGPTTGYLFPAEWGYVHGREPGQLAGSYRAGVYYDSSSAPSVGREGEKTGRYGAYLQGAQQIWRADAQSTRHIALFGVINVADSRTGLFPDYYEVGASWRGLLPSRTDDIASLGWAKANINRHLRATQVGSSQAQTNEQLFELNYSLQANRWLMLRPSLQYVVHPHGQESRPDTFVFVLHALVTL